MLVSAEIIATKGGGGLADGAKDGNCTRAPPAPGHYVRDARACTQLLN